MSYIINKTDGTVVTEIIDGLVDQVSTDLTLVGKNVSSYGSFINENFVFLLENFANTSTPKNPITGQLWYDTSEGRLKVYDGNGFKVSGGTIVSSVIPSTLVQGDIWIDSANQQLYFNDGQNTILAGPLYSTLQGKSGFEVVDVIDSNNISRTVVVLWCNQAVLGIYSKSAFVLPASSIPGFAATTVRIGFTSNPNENQVFDIVATTASGLIAQDGSTKVAEDFISRTENSSAYGTISILNSTPLVLGPGSETELKVNSNIIQFNSNVSNQNFGINVISGAAFVPAVRVITETKHVGIFTDLPTATLDVNGTGRIRDALTVDGELFLSAASSINVGNLAISTNELGDLLINGAPVGSTNLNAASTALITSNTLTVDFTKALISVTLIEDVSTITFTNVPGSGTTASTIVVFTQDNSGGRTVAGSGFITQAGAGLGISATGNSVSVVKFIAYGSTIIAEDIGQNYQ